MLKLELKPSIELNKRLELWPACYLVSPTFAGVAADWTHWPLITVLARLVAGNKRVRVGSTKLGLKLDK